jgi:hypothetical protein
MTDRYEQEAQPVPTPDGTPVEPPVPEVTGHAAVDATLAELAEAAELPPAEQVGAYEAAHRALQQTLSDIDQN